jgi:hypothetical protein
MNVMREGCVYFSSFAITIFGFLLASAVGGFSLLRAYEEFKKGIESKSKLRMWGSFFCVTFLYIIVTYAIVRGSNGSMGA